MAQRTRGKRRIRVARPRIRLAVRQVVVAMSHCVRGPMTKTPKPMPEKAMPAIRPRRAWNQREISSPIGTQPIATRPRAPSTPV